MMRACRLTEFQRVGLATSWQSWLKLRKVFSSQYRHQLLTLSTLWQQRARGLLTCLYGATRLPMYAFSWSAFTSSGSWACSWVLLLLLCPLLL